MIMCNSFVLFVCLKSDWKCDDFGRGKSSVAKSRNRRFIKKKAIREFLKDLE